MFCTTPAWSGVCSPQEPSVPQRISSLWRDLQLCTPWHCLYLRRESPFSSLKSKQQWQEIQSSRWVKSGSFPHSTVGHKPVHKPFSLSLIKMETSNHLLLPGNRLGDKVWIWFLNFILLSPSYTTGGKHFCRPMGPTGAFPARSALEVQITGFSNSPSAWTWVHDTPAFLLSVASSNADSPVTLQGYQEKYFNCHVTDKSFKRHTKAQAGV